MIRLDKYLAEMGIGSRQEVKAYIRKGRVTVDGTILRQADYKLDQDAAAVCVDGQPVVFVANEYYMLNKPAGVVSAASDAKATTVVDLIKSRARKDLFPVGRLDKDTEGLLLITNDGALAHRLLSPKKHVDKTYLARVAGQVTEQDIQAFAGGIDIGTDTREEWTMPGRLEIINSAAISEVRLTIQEGKYHQVKRMFQAVDKEVVYLKRKQMGSLVLDEHLQPGEYRMLTDEELTQL